MTAKEPTAAPRTFRFVLTLVLVLVLVIVIDLSIDLQIISEMTSSRILCSVVSMHSYSE
ncbi:MAG: hypothetical protein HUU46_22315 [Candidatus Hydrogenedentes bacterium]|nr:hypothetical protein [Candidatus Hydrogenedentota bacterium]